MLQNYAQISADAEALADRTDHEKRWVEYSGLCARLDSAGAETEKAGRAIEAAKAARRALSERTARGEPVTVEEITAAHAEVHEAELAFQHFVEVVSEVGRLKQLAHDALSIASAEVFRPAYDKGVAIRIEAAREADTARTLLEAATSKFEYGTGLMQVAMARGCKPPHGCYGVSSKVVNTEAKEKALWNVPAYPHGQALAAA